MSLGDSADKLFSFGVLQRLSNELQKSSEPSDKRRKVPSDSRPEENTPRVTRLEPGGKRKREDQNILLYQLYLILIDASNHLPSLKMVVLDLPSLRLRSGPRWAAVTSLGRSPNISTSLALRDEKLRKRFSSLQTGLSQITMIHFSASKHTVRLLVEKKWNFR